MSESELTADEAMELVRRLDYVGRKLDDLSIKLLSDASPGGVMCRVNWKGKCTLNSFPGVGESYCGALLAALREVQGNKTT